MESSMTPEESQTDGIASLIAMLGLIFAYRSGYYHRMLMVDCMVQPTSWSQTHSWTFLMVADTAVRS